MKKIYLLAATALFAFTANAQIELEDNIDGYSQGPVSTQASHWKTWGDTVPESAIVSANQSFSPPLSVRVGEGNANEIDQLLMIESVPTDGIYTVQWKMFVPSNKEGYFNMQETAETSGAQTQSLVGGNIYFNQDNENPGVGNVDGDGAVTFDFSHDTWFNLKLVYDLDAMNYSMFIDANQVITDKTLTFNTQMGDTIAAVDFFSPSADTEFYVDDIVLSVGLLGSDEFSSDVFSVYPNPVVNKLNIKSASVIDNVTIYDVLGKQVLSVNPDAVSPSVDMSALSSGAYLVNVTIGDASKTIKVLK